jgi:polar amino acid transport system substrate-binding protein
MSAFVHPVIAFAMSAFLATVSLTSNANAASTKDRVLGSKTVTAGIHNAKPWGYLTSDGKVEGFNADIVKAVFEPLGVKVNFVVGDFGSLIPGLIANRFDLVDDSVVITPERCKIVAFANPELTSVDAVLVKKGNPKQIHSYDDVIRNPALKIGGSRGSQQAKNAAFAGVKGDQLQLFQNTESTVSALTSNRVDGITFTSGTANAMLTSPELSAGIERASPFTGRTDGHGKPYASYVATVFRPDESDLRDFYNNRLAELKADGTIARIMARYGFKPDEKAPNGLTSDQVCTGKD